MPGYETFITCFFGIKVSCPDPALGQCFGHLQVGLAAAAVGDAEVGIPGVGLDGARGGTQRSGDEDITAAFVHRTTRMLGAQLRQFHRRHVPGVGHGQM